MIIAGAGLAGLIAGNIFRNYSPRIIERQESLPNNHKAILRFRDHSVSEATGIEFKKVKSFLHFLSSIAFMVNSYLLGKIQSSISHLIIYSELHSFIALFKHSPFELLLKSLSKR